MERCAHLRAGGDTIMADMKKNGLTGPGRNQAPGELSSDRTGHDHLDPRTVDDTAELGELDHALHGPRLQGPRPGISRTWGRGRGPARGSVSDRVVVRACNRREPRDAHRRARPAADIMGHSFGGALTQILLDRGFGAAGVAIDSVPAEGIKVVPPSQIRASFPVLKNPANRHRAVGFTPEQFHYAFTNTLSEEESLAAYERYHVPAPGSWVWGGVLANFTPGHQDTYVDFKNDDRAPLLFIAGGEDNIMPPSVNESNVHHYRKSQAVTDYKEFPGRSHFTVGQQGWEEVADYALDWAREHAALAPRRVD